MISTIQVIILIASHIAVFSSGYLLASWYTIRHYERIESLPEWRKYQQGGNWEETHGEV